MAFGGFWWLVVTGGGLWGFMGDNGWFTGGGW